MKQISLSSVFIIGPSKVAESSNKNQVEELVRKAMRGDETAFGQLYDLYFEKVYRFVFYRVRTWFPKFSYGFGTKFPEFRARARSTAGFSKSPATW